MKPELPALVMPVSMRSQVAQSLGNRQPGQDLASMRNDVDCMNDAGSVFNDFYGNGTGGLYASASFNRPIHDVASSVKTKKKRFG